MSFKFNGIDHIGVAVENLAVARKTYETVLGFTVSGEETLPERGLEVCFVETGNAKIELIAPTREDSEVSSFLRKRGEGIHHLCVAVDDIDGAVTQMRERGARIIGDGVQSGAKGTRVAFLHPKGTHGVLIELVEGGHH